MARKRFTAEQSILKLRQAEVSLAKGKAVGCSARLWSRGSSMDWIAGRTSVTPRRLRPSSGQDSHPGLGTP